MIRQRALFLFPKRISFTRGMKAFVASNPSPYGFDLDGGLTEKGSPVIDDSGFDHLGVANYS
jgi:hypothetical protein